MDANLKRELTEAVSEWAPYHGWESEGDIASDMAETNAIFSDAADIDEVIISEGKDGVYKFKLTGELVGNQREDTPFCGSKMSFSAEGVIHRVSGINRWNPEVTSVHAGIMDF